MMFLLVAISVLSTITAKNYKTHKNFWQIPREKQIKANLVKQLTEEFEDSNS